jgi:hypothetical protein
MAKVWIKVCNAKSEGQAKASNTTDLDGGHLSPHLISICQIFRDILKLTSIAGIYNLAQITATTTYEHIKTEPFQLRPLCSAQ